MPAELIACFDCDLLQYKIDLAPGACARCVRCQSKLYARALHHVDYPIAWALSAVAFYTIANAFPVLRLEVQGQVTSTTLIGAALTMQTQGKPLVAALVMGTTLIAPLTVLLAMLYVLVPLRFNVLSPGFATITRVLQAVAPWGMLEVFVFGILVALVKLQHVATVISGVGLWGFIALMLTSVAASASFDPHLVWEHIAAVDSHDEIR